MGLVTYLLNQIPTIKTESYLFFSGLRDSHLGQHFKFVNLSRRLLGEILPMNQLGNGDWSPASKCYLGKRDKE